MATSGESRLVRALKFECGLASGSEEGLLTNAAKFAGSFNFSGQRSPKGGLSLAAAVSPAGCALGPTGSACSVATEHQLQPRPDCCRCADSMFQDVVHATHFTQLSSCVGTSCGTGASGPLKFG